MNDLASPDQLPKDLKKFIIFNDVRAKEPVFNEYFCRCRHNNCNMIYPNQILISLDRQNVRENCNLLILFRQEVKPSHLYIMTSFVMFSLAIMILLGYVTKYRESPITILSLMKLKITILMLN